MRYALAGITEQQGGALITTGASAGSAIAAGALFGSVVPGIGTAVGAAVGIIGALITSLFTPNYSKINASNYANQIETMMQQNLANWLSLPSSQKYASVQQAALDVFNTLWAQYQQDVQVDLAKAPDSISDRQQGSCAYHTADCAGWNGDTYTPNEPNQATGCCWNWFVGYYDPIANDPNVISDDTPVGATENLAETIGSTVGLNSSTTLLLLGGGLLAFVILTSVKL